MLCTGRAKLITHVVHKVTQIKHVMRKYARSEGKSAVHCNLNVVSVHVARCALFLSLIRDWSKTGVGCI